MSYGSPGLAKTWRRGTKHIIANRLFSKTGKISVNIFTDDHIQDQ